VESVYTADSKSAALRLASSSLARATKISDYEELIIDWAEDRDDPTGTVYGYVPVSVVTNVLAKHGGMVSGEVPAGVAPLAAV
jgi:hypothetical protein